jgi:hypothetical protein
MFDRSLGEVFRGRLVDNKGIALKPTGGGMRAVKACNSESGETRLHLAMEVLPECKLQLASAPEAFGAS